MSKDDGTLNLDGEVTPLMKLLLRRRSVRKYEPGLATAEQVRRVLEGAQAFAARAGFSSPRLQVVEGDTFDRVVKAAMAGLLGKINPWLAFTKVRQMIMCGAVYPSSEDRAGVERAVKEAAMTMQVALLFATEAGLGTCWMAGINHDRVEEAHPMPDGARLIALSPLGLPPSRMGLSWDALSHHLVSKKRKPLSELRMDGAWRNP